MKHNKICIGFNDIIGYADGLKIGLEGISENVDVFYIDKSKYNFTRSETRSLWLDIYRMSMGAMNSTITTNRIIKFPFYILSKISLFIFYFLLPFQYKRFILLSSFPKYEFLLKWLSRFNTRVVVVLFGSEVRPARIDGALISLYNGDIEKLNRVIEDQIKFIRIVEKYATRIVSHPPISLFERVKFAQYLKIGIPINIDYTRFQSKSNNNILKILHAPSDFKSKGTLEIRDAIEKLISDGYKLIYKEVRNISNDELLKEISQCDIVIDQLYSDIPISRLALESIFCGVPVLVGSYHTFSKYNLHENIDYPEVYLFNPNNFESVLKHVIENKQERIDKANRSRAFVVEKWNSREIAKKFVGLLKGGAKPSVIDSYHESKDWFYEPDENNTETLYGYGRKYY